MEKKELTQEEKDKLQNFQLELKKVCNYFKLDLVPVLNFTKQGIIAGLEIQPIQEEQPKEEEAKKVVEK